MTDHSDDKSKQAAPDHVCEERINHIPDWIWEADPDGVITYSNRAVKYNLGYAVSKVIGRPLFSLLAPGEVDKFHNSFNEAKKTKKPVANLLAYFMHKDGAEKLLETSCVPIIDSNRHITGIRGVSRDAETDNALLQAERRYQELVESVPVIVWRGSAEKFEFTFVSREAEIMLGYPIERWINEPTFWQDHLHPEDRERVMSACIHAKEKLQPHELEYRMIAADGSIVWIRDIVQGPVKITDSKEEVFGAMINITGRKQAEEELNRSKEKYRNLVENVSDWVWEVDENIIRTYASPRSINLLGYEPEEIIGKTPFDFMSPEEAKRVKDIFQPIMEKHEPFTLLDNTLVHKDGHLVTVETSGTPIFDKQGVFRGYRGIDRDVTERRQYAERLDKLNKCFLSFSIDPVANINCLTALAGELLGATCALYSGLESGMLYAWGQWHTHPGFISIDKPEGHACYDAIRYGLSEPFLVRNLPETSYARTDPNISKSDLRTFIGQAVIFNGEPVGSLCCAYQGDYVPNEGDKWFLGIIASAIAVEERRRCAERELRESEEQYRVLFESNPNPMWVYDLETLAFLAVNDAAIIHYGYSQEEFLSMTIKDIRPPKDIPALLENISRITSGLDEAGMWRHKKKDGTVIDVEITSHTIDFSGRLAEMVLAYDVTEQKQVKEALQANEALLKLFVVHTPAAVAMFDNEMRYLLCSKRWLTDYKLGDRDITGLSHYEVFPDIPDRWKEIHQRVLSGNVERCEEDAFERVDGSVDWIKWELHPWRNEAGKIGGAIMFTEVITERKRMALALQEAETKYRSLVEESLVGVYIIQDNRYVYVNPQFAEIFGYTQEEITSGITPIDITAPESREVVTRNIEERMTGKAKSRHYTFKAIRKDGRKIDVEVLGSVTAYEDKPAIIGSLLDITERVRSEEAVRYSEERYRLLFENSPDMVFVIRDSEITAANPAVQRILGYEPSELIGLSPWDLSPEYQPGGITSQAKAEKYRSLVLTEGPQIFEWIHKRKDGSLVFCDVNVTAYTVHGEVFMQAIVRDITERKRVEEARRRFERQIERQKRQFYRDTIMSVTEGKLDIADTSDIKPYLSHSELKIDMRNAYDVAGARHEIEQFCRDKGLTGERLESFMIGVGEAMANAVKHGTRGRVFAGTTDKAIWIGIADLGKGIESLILPRATLLRGFSTKPSMGLGYTLMLDVADRIILKTGEHGTTVILIKNIEEPVFDISTDLFPDTWRNIPDL